MSAQADQAKGHGKEAAGLLTGDEDLQAQGKAERVAGEAKERTDTVEGGPDKVQHTLNDVLNKAEGNTFGIHQPDPKAKDPDPRDDFEQLASDSIADHGNGQATASLSSASGHDDPQRRREVVDTVFDDPRIHGADHVTVAVPRGDFEALDEVRSRLDDEHTRAAGSTVIVEGRPSGDVPGLADDGSNLTQGPNANE